MSAYRHYVPNPYGAPYDAWPEEVRKAHKRMPPTASGHVIQPQFLDPAHQPAYTARWRRWSEAHPRRLWPTWLAAWLDSHPEVAE